MTSSAKGGGAMAASQLVLHDLGGCSAPPAVTPIAEPPPASAVHRVELQPMPDDMYWVKITPTSPATTPPQQEAADSAARPTTTPAPPLPPDSLPFLSEFPIQLAPDHHQQSPPPSNGRRTRAPADSAFDCLAASSSAAAPAVAPAFSAGRAGVRYTAERLGRMRTDHAGRLLRRHAESCLATLVASWLQEGERGGRAVVGRCEAGGGDTAGQQEKEEDLLAGQGGGFGEERLFDVLRVLHRRRGAEYVTGQILPRLRTRLQVGREGR